MHYRPTIIMPQNDLAVAARHIRYKREQIVFVNIPLPDGITSLGQNNAFDLQVF